MREIINFIFLMIAWLAFCFIQHKYLKIETCPYIMLYGYVAGTISIWFGNFCGELYGHLIEGNDND